MICPQRFAAPLAPPEAARAENVRVNSELLGQGAQEFRESCSILLIEGAGGLLCPLSDDSTVLDLAVELKSELVVVAANRLGVLNHTLLTVECARARGLNIAAIILNNVLPPSARPDDQSMPANADLLDRWIHGIPILQCDFEADRLSRVNDNALTDVLSHALNEQCRPSV